MFIFLPDDVVSNMTLLEESLTAEFVQDLSMTLLPANVALTLPALRLSYSTELLSLLGDIGESVFRLRTHVFSGPRSFGGSYKSFVGSHPQ